MLEQLLTNPFLYSLSLTLLHFLWQGLLVATVLKSALLIIDKSKARLRYALSSFAMLANLLFAVATFLLIYPNKTAVATVGISPIPLTSLVSELTQQNPLLTYQELLPSILAYSLPYIALLWLISISTLACKLLVEIHNVNHLPKHAYLLPSSELLTRFNALAKQIKLAKTPRLLISLKVDVPMAIGWLKPVVLLPASMVSGLNSAQLEMLILHELAHIRRYDYLVNFLQTLVELLFFFHPSVAWVAKQMRNEREYCSDDIAVQYCGDPIAYAHTLADTASLCTQRHSHTIPSMAMAASGGDLKERVIRLVDHHCAPSNNASKWFAAVSIMLSIALIFSNPFLSKKLISNSLPQQWQINEQLAPSKSQNEKLKNSFLANNRVIEDSSDNEHLNHLSNNSHNVSSIAGQLLKKENKTEQLTLINYLKESYQLTTHQMGGSALLNTSAVQNTIDKISPRNHLIPEPSLLATTKIEMKTNTLSKTEPAKTTEQKKPLARNLTLIAKAPTKKINFINNDLKTTEVDAINLPRKFKANSAIQSRIARADSAIKTLNQSAERDSLGNIVLPHTESTPYNSTATSLYQQRLTLSASNKQHLTITEPNYIQSSATNNDYFNSPPILHGAKQLKSVDPVYPSLAKRKGIEIEVKVRFTIDENGQVKDITFAKQSRINYFKSAIRTAIRKWRFVPAKRNEQAIESQMSKIFSFSLQA